MKTIDLIKKRLFDIDEMQFANEKVTIGKIIYPKDKSHLTVAVSLNSNGTEHVSVSKKKKIPTWEEMCFIKDLCFEDEEEVIQIHPKKSEYVNIYPNCLHLWRKIKIEW